MPTDLTQVLLTILLLLLAIIGVGLVILLGLAIKTVLEIFALAKTVRKEISTVSSALRMIGEGIGDKVGSVFGVLDFFKKPAKKVAKTVKRTSREA